MGRPQRSAYPGEKPPIRPVYGPDADEVEALGMATAEFTRLCGDRPGADAIVSAIISTWIITRTRLTAGARLTETVAFDLGDAQMRGMLEAALPHIGAALAGLPADVPLFSLSKPQVIDAFTAAVQGWRAAAVAMGENPSLPMDDGPRQLPPFNPKLGDEVPF